MYIDARSLSNWTVIDTEVCIVGGGAAGISLASQLAEKSIQVAILESGQLNNKKRTQQLCLGEIDGLPYDLIETRSRFFGGSTNCWGGWCRPLDENDFETRDWIPHSGWPITKSDLDPYYAHAMNVCRLDDLSFDPDYWESTIGTENCRLLRSDDARVCNQITLRSSARYFGQNYREAFRADPNITVYLNANASEIESSENAKAVTAVHAMTLSGNKFAIKAKAFVLAAGAIENARLLLLSDKVERRGLGNSSDLVGRFFADHPKVQTSVFDPTDPTFHPDIYDVAYAFFNLPIVSQLSLAPDVTAELKLTNIRTYITSIYYGHEAQGFEALKKIYMSLQRKSWPDQLAKRVGDMLLDAPQVASGIIARYFHPSWLRKNFQFQTTLEPAPNPDSRVTLSQSRDALGLKRVKLTWRLSPIERRSLHTAHRIFDEWLRSSGQGRLIMDMSEEEDAWPETTSWSWHHMGTTRMSSDPSQGVVDPNCRIHGMANLYVAGGSVFPTYGVDTPTLTIVALALRLADHMVATLKAPCGPV